MLLLDLLLLPVLLLLLLAEQQRVRQLPRCHQLV
jgi:hypothetical protein